MLHVALAKFIDDQENYGVYKEVIKELLQFGARRDLKNKDGLTPYDLVLHYEPLIILKTKADYMDNDIKFDDYPENQYEKLKFYLGMNTRENSFCCPKHAPLEKVKRSSRLMKSFLFLNLIIMLLEIAFFIFIFVEIVSDKFRDEIVWVSFLSTLVFFYTMSLLFFFLVHFKDPGYTKSIPIKDFY